MSDSIVIKSEPQSDPVVEMPGKRHESAHTHSDQFLLESLLISLYPCNDFMKIKFFFFMI